MKKIFMVAAVAISGLFLTTNVYAQDTCTVDDVTLNSSNLSDCSTITLKSGTTYTGDLTITKDVTIVGNGATINGTIKITGGTNINISNLTMTGETHKNNQAKPEYISIQAKNVKLNVSNVNIYYGSKNESSQFTKYGTGIVVYAPTGDGSTVEVTNSVIHTKYAIWIEGSNSNLSVKNSELSGYAALDLTSSSKTSNNNITIDNSTLTGYAIGDSKDKNNYGTIVIGKKDNVNINIINNSVITNNFANGNDARSDLILISNGDATNVEVDVSDSILNNTNDAYGAVYNSNGTSDNSFKTKNTTIIGKLIEGEKDQFYVDFVVDEKSNVVLVNKDGKLSSEDIPNVEKAGYTFDGWFDENGKLFDTTKNVTSNLIVNAKFTKIPESSSKADDAENPNTGVENPQTGDGIITYIVMGTLSLLSLTGLTTKRFLFNKN